MHILLADDMALSGDMIDKRGGIGVWYCHVSCLVLLTATLL